jgi:PAS domain S-box-containing protein
MGTKHDHGPDADPRIADAAFKDHRAVMLLVDPGTGAIVDANIAACAWYGWTRDELRAMRIDQISTSGEDLQPEMAERASRQDTASRKHRLADGTIRDVEVYSAPIEVEGRTLVHSVVRDASEHLASQAALRRSEAQLRALIDSVPDIVFQIDRDYRLVIANDHHVRASIATQGRAIAIGECMLEADYPEEMVRAWRKDFDRALAGESFVVERSHPHPDGRHFSEDHFAPVRETDGVVSGVVVTSHDVTARERTDQALRESEARFRGYFEQTLVGVIVAGADMRLQEVNQATCDLLGYSREELLALTWADITHPDDVATDLARNQRVMARGVDSLRIEKRFIHKNGSVVAADMSLRCQRKADGSVDYFLGFLSDMTERKQTDQRLQLIMKAVESTSDAIGISDARGHHIFQNHALSALFGYETAEELEAAGGGPVVVKDPAVARELFETIESGKSWAGELDMVTRSGRVFSAHERADAICDPEGRIIGLIGIISDVTERKQAEEALERSRLLLRASLESQRDTILFSIDHDYRYLYFNKAHSDVMKSAYGKDVALGMCVLDCITSDEDRIVAKQNYDRALSGESHTNVRVYGEIERAYYESFFNPILDESGEIMGATGLARDITERRLAEAELQQSQALLQAAMDRSQAGIAIADAPDGKLRYVNEAGLFIRGGAAAEVVDHVDVAAYVASWHILHHDGTPYAPEEVPLARAVLFGETSEAEFIIRRDDHEDRLVLARAAPIRDADGVVTAGVVVFHDITERKLAEDEVRRLNAELEQRVVSRTAQLEAANKELESFAYSVSHDLRAPLRAIDGFSQMVVEDAADHLAPDDLEHLQRVRSAAQRMASLIDDLLGLSRTSRQDLLRQNVDLSAMATAVIEELREAEPERHVDIIVAPQVRANADPALLRVILGNLLGNAWKFTSKHDEAHIQVGVIDADGQRAFFVRDDGAGFDAGAAQHLFGAFQRFHTAQEFEGNGIGLATVQRLVIRHGGRVWAEAEVEKGATFFFTLPEPAA